MNKDVQKFRIVIAYQWTITQQVLWNVLNFPILLNILVISFKKNVHYLKQEEKFHTPNDDYPTETNIRFGMYVF